MRRFNLRLRWLRAQEAPCTPLPSGPSQALVPGAVIFYQNPGYAGYKRTEVRSFKTRLSAPLFASRHTTLVVSPAPSTSAATSPFSHLNRWFYGI